MPWHRVNQVRTLKDLCIKYVAEEMARKWTEFFEFDATFVHPTGVHRQSYIKLLQQGEDEELYEKYVKPILDLLPSTLLLDITSHDAWYSRVSSEIELLRHYMKMFLSRKIYLTGLSHGTLDALLQVASNRCPLVVSLKILDTCHFDKYLYTLEKFLPKFLKLQDLDISGLDIEDSCLEVLGTFCKDLRRLDVGFCKKVTDAGIKALCVSVDHLGNANEALGQCKSIVELSTCWTQVTIIGIHIGLKNFPNLTFWDEVSFETLMEMNEKMDLKKEFEEIPKCFLSMDFCELRRNFFNQDAGYTSGSLKMVLPFCPNLSDVLITTIPGFKDPDLTCLAYLEKLCALRIYGYGESYGPPVNEITFDGGIIPLLKVKGPNLIRLELTRFLSPINITKITELCPNLRILRLCDNHIHNSMSQQMFEMKKLEHLVIEYPRCDKCCEKKRIPSENLAFLLSSPLLKYSFVNSSFIEACRLHF